MKGYRVGKGKGKKRGGQKLEIKVGSARKKQEGKKKNPETGRFQKMTSKPLKP